MSQDPKKKAKKKATSAKGKKPEGRAAYKNGYGEIAGKHNQHILTPEVLGMIERHAYLGANIKRICYILDISRDTFNRYQKEFPEFDAAYKKGRAKVVSDLIETGLDLAIKKKNPMMIMDFIKLLGKGYVDYPEENEPDKMSDTTSVDKNRLKEAIKKDKFIDIVEVSPEPRAIDVGGKDAKKDGKK